MPVAVAYLSRGTPTSNLARLRYHRAAVVSLEFSIGHQFIPKPAQSTLHLAAYGVSILLALAIFLQFRRLKGMKIDLPRSGRD